MHKLELIAVFAATVAITSSASGQQRLRDNDGIPPGQRPRAGMCRIWIDGVPPGQQPAPTDCTTAERRRPSNARVIYGDQTRNDRGRHENVSNGSIVTIDGRQCVRRDDRQGNITYRCPNGVYDSRGVFDRSSRTDDRQRVFDRSDDDRNDKKFKKPKKGKGHH